MSGWEEFFDGYAKRYLSHSFTHHTLAEVGFLEAELGLAKGAWILDMGCGTGRHAVELAGRGYRVTGIDISQGMLDEARRSGAAVEWVRCDATKFEPTRSYDAAICLCEGAFGLLGAAADPATHDLAILENLRAALRPGGKLVLNALSGPTATRPCEEAPGLFEHTYAAADLAALVERAGFSVEHIGGGTAGNWGRRPVDEADIELMCIASAR